MGWERKRGKLHELNQLILGEENLSFAHITGDVDALKSVRYVITLDADTVLPIGAANRLVGTLAHPLNQAVFAGESGRVTAGYTVLQPRVEISPRSANRSLFTRIYSGDVGLDLYTLAVSDVYQDLTGEGIYVGKGIYDVRAFERSIARQIPENRLLSHDLLEGLLGRAGLVTDIRHIVTKKGDAMALLTLEDITGVLNVVLFPRTWEQYRDIVQEDRVIIVGGKADTARGTLGWSSSSRKAAPPCRSRSHSSVRCASCLTRLWIQKNEEIRSPRVTGVTWCRLVPGYSTMWPAGSLTRCAP